MEKGKRAKLLHVILFGTKLCHGNDATLPTAQWKCLQVVQTFKCKEHSGHEHLFADLKLFGVAWGKHNGGTTPPKLPQRVQMCLCPMRVDHDDISKGTSELVQYSKRLVVSARDACS